MKNTDKGVRTEAIILLKYSRVCLWAQRVYIRYKNELRHDLRVTFSRPFSVRAESGGPERAQRNLSGVGLRSASKKRAPRGARHLEPHVPDQSSRANAMSSTHAALGVSTRAAALYGFSSKVRARRRPSPRALTIFAIRSTRARHANAR